jgi:polyhydroxybutyrate depolymerase
MRKKYTFILLLFAIATMAQAQIQQFEWQGVQREYLVKIPSEHNETTPVLYFLHGLGDNITRLDNEFHFQQVADDFGWMLVVPQALNEGYGTMWNAYLTYSTTDDSGFLMALLDSLSEQYPVNQDSVFFTGFSMGGFMTHRMAIEHGDRITACAPVSGLITSYMANFTAVAPVKMLHIHGTNDPVVGYDGNSQYFGYDLGLSVDEILDYWKNANHCVDEPVIDTFPDLHNDGLRFVRYTYEGDAELQHIKVIGGNHSWYHSEDQYDIGYLTEIHKFFTTGSVQVGIAEPVSSGLRLWPNPTSGLCTIEVDVDTDLTVFDLQRRIMATYPIHKGTNSIDLGSLQEGLYFIKTADGTVRKVLVRK